MNTRLNRVSYSVFWAMGGLFIWYLRRGDADGGFPLKMFAVIHLLALPLGLVFPLVARAIRNRLARTFAGQQLTCYSAAFAMLYLQVNVLASCMWARLIGPTFKFNWDNSAEQCVFWSAIVMSSGLLAGYASAVFMSRVNNRPISA